RSGKLDHAEADLVTWCGWRRFSRRGGPAIGVSLLCLLFAPAALAQERGEIRVKVVGLRSDQGMLRFGLFNKKETFATEGGALVSGAYPIKNGQCEFVIPDLPYGAYALIVAHDVNGDGKIDRNPFSPELKGISNYSGKIFWFPNFDKARFPLDRSS